MLIKQMAGDNIFLNLRLNKFTIRIKREDALKKYLLVLILILLSFSLSALTENPSVSEKEVEFVPEYDLGDQIFGVNLGAIIPLFFDFYNLTGEDRYVSALDYYKFPLGGMASLEWNSYLNNSMTLGFEIGAMFAITYNNTHSMIPITFSYNYIIDFFPFYMPLSVEAGVVINRLASSIFFGPIVKPGVSFYWNTNSDWDFGLNLKYWIVPEIYFGEAPPVTDSSIGNFLEISLSAVFHL